MWDDVGGILIDLPEIHSYLPAYSQLVFRWETPTRKRRIQTIQAAEYAKVENIVFMFKIRIYLSLVL